MPPVQHLGGLALVQTALHRAREQLEGAPVGALASTDAYLRASEPVMSALLQLDEASCPTPELRAARRRLAAEANQLLDAMAAAHAQPVASSNKAADEGSDDYSGDDTDDQDNNEFTCPGSDSQEEEYTDCEDGAQTDTCVRLNLQPQPRPQQQQHTPCPAKMPKQAHQCWRAPAAQQQQLLALALQQRQAAAAAAAAQRLQRQQHWAACLHEARLLQQLRRRQSWQQQACGWW